MTTTRQPPLLHVDSAPLLTRKSTGGNTTPRSLPILPSQIRKDKDQNLYREVTIELPVADIKKHPTNQAFDKRVSFDTVNIDYESDGSEYDDDSPYNPYESNNIDYFALDRSPSPGGLRGRSVSPSRNMSPYTRSLSPGGIDAGMNRGRSPNLSPRRGSNDGLLSPSLDALFRSVTRGYPTNKIIDHNGCTYTKVHREYEALYSGKLKPKTPVLPGRVILVYISGRKHTWVALDWVTSNFLEDGDSLVVVSSINPEAPPRRRSVDAIPRNVIKSENPKRRLKERNQPQFAREITGNIMTYLMAVLPGDKIIKLTVELAVGKTKEVLKDMYQLYQPSLVVASMKPPSFRSGKAAPMRSWVSGRLTDRLVKNFPLPVIVVPAVNMDDFEEELFERISKEYEIGWNCAYKDEKMDDHLDYSTKKGPSDVSKTSVSMTQSESMPTSAVTTEEGSTLQSSSAKESEEFYSDSESDSQSIDSDESYSSKESNNSFQEIMKIFSTHKATMNKQKKNLEDHIIDDGYYKTMLEGISDGSLRLCNELLAISPTVAGPGAKLAVEITGSNKLGVPIKQTKSMLLDIPEASDEKKDSHLSHNTSKNVGGPKISIHPSSPTLSSANTNSTHGTRSTTLKFLDSKPNNGSYSSLGKPANKNALKKSLSHEVPSSASKLEPTKSNPDTQIDASKKKKKSIWKSMLGKKK